MAIPNRTYRLVKGSSLTHLEMDNNFRSVIYSGSIHDSGTTLHLHYDTQEATDFITVPLGAASAGLTIVNNLDNNILTATGQTGTVQGESGLKFNTTGKLLTVVGRVSITDTYDNVILGASAGDNLTSGDGEKNVLLGISSGPALEGDRNVAAGFKSLYSAVGVGDSIAIGELAFSNLVSGNRNVALGRAAGSTLTAGDGNIYIGNFAGPVFSSTQSNKLYINNQASNVPLILGDFSTGTVVFNSTVSASYFSGSYYGDGSNLTGITGVASEWDGTLDGNAQITGSLTVSGANVIVDFTNVEAISGSIFSGSFYGDGSNLTGITADSFPYTGSARITGSLEVEGKTGVTGSFTVSGAFPLIKLKGDTTIDTNILIKNYGASALAIGDGAFLASTAVKGVAIGTVAGRNAGGSVVSIGNNSGYYANEGSTYIGASAGGFISGRYNTAIGQNSLLGAVGKGKENTAVGADSARGMRNGQLNTVVGYQALYSMQDGHRNTAIGGRALYNINLKHYENTAIGVNAGLLVQGSSNVIIGANAGPAGVSPVNTNNKLYINNSQSNTPLILGDFNKGSVTIHSEVSASKFLGTYYGDGSNLSGLEWDGSHSGSAEITGSFTVSGSTAVVDMTDTLAISGSNFSGSFAGDGSNLTGVASEWDGSHNGNASITGSLIVSGALDVADTVTISSTGYPGGAGVELIHVSKTASGVNTTIITFDAAHPGGYTGFKADYSLVNSTISESRTGFLLGSWDTSSTTQITDRHTLSIGTANTATFTLTKTGNQVTLVLVSSLFSTLSLNTLITAFKKQV